MSNKQNVVAACLCAMVLCGAIAVGAYYGATAANRSTSADTSSSTTLSHSNCLGEPCRYVGQCRSPGGDCGYGTAYCGANSTWTADGCCLALTRRRLSSCTGDPCTPPNCRSSYNYCGSDTAWCNSQSIWTPSCSPSSGSSGTTNAPTSTSTNTGGTSHPSFSPIPPSITPTSASPTTAIPTVTIICPTSAPTHVGDTRSPTSPSSSSSSSSSSSAPTLPGGSINPTTPTPPPSTTTGNSGSAGGNGTDDVSPVLIAQKSSVSAKILQSQTPQNTWITSTVYDPDSLITAVGVAASGIAGLRLAAAGAAGKLNVAAFLAQAMRETIQYDVCDENNWDLINGVYPLSNACGQLGQNYASYTCDASESMMQCTVVSTMQQQAMTNAKWWGAPPPMKCAPVSVTGTPTGSWNPSASCPNNVCSDYPGQKGGAYETTGGTNTAGRSDIEGCCWWGRGAIQLSGPCNIGKLNYFLGAAAKTRGASAPYGDVDFCADPGAICQSTKYPELKWISGLFYWLREVQSWNSDGFNYLQDIETLAGDNTQANRKTFIDKVSGIVNRGCPSLSCPSGTVDGASDREANFEVTWGVLGS